MKRITSWVRAFFGFSKTETNAFVILLPLMVVLIFSEPIYRYWFVNQKKDYSKDHQRLDSLMAAWKWESDSAVTEIIEPVNQKRLTMFNPNHASKEELISLGFNQSLATRIVNYRLKGGKFIMKGDLMKIYGMDSSFFQGMAAYVDLPEAKPEKLLHSKFDVKEAKAVVKFDLNTADTIQLKKIYGIGPKLSQRIVSYREKLGGFISLAQLNEVYGLDSGVVRELQSKSFVEVDFKPRRVNVNTSTEKELGTHPYIKYKISRAIVAYRSQHGDFKTVDDLKKVAIVEEASLQKMQPYIEVK